MKMLRTFAVLALTGLTLLPFVGAAQADHRPRWRNGVQIHLPQRVVVFPGWEDNDFMEEAEEDYIRSKRARLRERLREARFWEDDFDDEEYEPVYQPPRKAKKVKSPSAKPISRASVEKYRATKSPSRTKMAAAKTKPVKVASQPRKVSKTPVKVASVTPKPKVPSTTQTKSVAAPPAPGSIAITCARGTDIIAGYGFNAVTPKTCSGETFSFDAKRADSLYVSKLSSATGEITDVKKVN